MESGSRIGVAAGFGAGAGSVFGESDFTAVDGAGSAARSASSTIRAVGAGADVETEVSCESPLRSVFDEPGGLDFAIVEDFLG
jgi:hypothetical protein